MTDEILLKLLKETFPTKADHDDLTLHIDQLQKQVAEGFTSVQDRLDDVKASANALDSILEEHPIHRIERLETNAGLPSYVPVGAEE